MSRHQIRKSTANEQTLSGSPASGTRIRRELDQEISAWFASQPLVVRRAILSQYPQHVNARAADLILERLAHQAAA